MSGSRTFTATTIFERSERGRRASTIPTTGVAADTPGASQIPDHLRRAEPPRLPEVSEPTLVRHYVGLSQANHNIDTGFYPLGSCTMKYNPKVHDQIAAMPGFARLHPMQQTDASQGMLHLLADLGDALATLSGLPAVSLAPAAGAHGEFTGLMIMRGWHEYRLKTGAIDEMPTHVIIPDTAHGTNPASVTMAGFSTVSVATDAAGGMDIDELRQVVADHSVVGLMLTNPNTLGLLDTNITEIADIVHEAGGLLYYDGANFNAIMGKARPGDMGFDIVHFNVHKTFSTPHGGGGPGAGPVAVTAELGDFLPVPVLRRADDGSIELTDDLPHTMGHIGHFHGNAGVLLRAWAYIRRMGRDGLTAASERAVLNANYLQKLLEPVYGNRYGRVCMHEFVVSAQQFKRTHKVKALDIAKRLMDSGYHPPTIYFPLLVPEAMMIEPTETETRETLQGFAAAMLRIADEVESQPGIITSAPHTTPVRRLDEVRALKELCIRYEFPPADAPPVDPNFEASKQTESVPSPTI